MVQAGRSGVPVGTKNVSLHQNVETALGPTRSPIQWVPELKRPPLEVNYSPLSDVEFRNECSYATTAGVSLHGLERENFISQRRCPLGTLTELQREKSEIRLLFAKAFWSLLGPTDPSVQWVSECKAAGAFGDEENGWSCTSTAPYAFMSYTGAALSLPRREHTA
jgi:hypothetical protein